MNKRLGQVASIINAVTVLAFAIFMLIGWNYGSYFVCILLALSFVMMIAAFENECKPEYKVAGKIALAMAVIYATLILIVYFTQCTTVTNENLNGEAARLLDYRHLSLLFNLDLLGYGIMALATFFIGLTVNSKTDKALKMLLLIHGIFFFSCLIMPMLGIFKDSGGSTLGGGVIALEIWCAYFLPISILSYLHFRKAK